MALFYIVSLFVLANISLCQLQLQKIPPNLKEQSIVFANIPKNVWQYWWQGLEQLNFGFKLTIFRNKRLLEAQGWKHYLLDRQSIKKYIELPTHINFSQFQQRHEADWIRLKLLYDYGGLWIDSNIIILESLNFLYSLNSNGYVFNKFDSGPYIYGSFMDSYGTREVEIDSQGKNIRLSPGFEISFIAAIPNSSLILQTRLQLQKFYTSEQGFFKAIDKTLEIENVKIGNQNRYYLATNMAFQVCLQRKQHQLDNNFIGRNRKYAVKQYRLWCTENLHGNYQLQHLSSFLWDQTIILMVSANINDLQYPLWGQVGPRYSAVIWYASFFYKYYDNLTAPLNNDQWVRIFWRAFIQQVYPQLSQLHRNSFAAQYILNQTLQANKQFGLNISRISLKQPLKELQFCNPTHIGWIIITINFLLFFIKYPLIILLCIIIGYNSYTRYWQQIRQIIKQDVWVAIQESQ